MASGLLALLDDVALIARIAAASLDDVAAKAAKAGAKAAGIVIDDAAVTPRYVVGFAAERELPIIGRIAWASIRNKALILLPAALLLNFALPWLLNPLLMLGGAYLCAEGFGKVMDWVRGEGGGKDDGLAAGADPKEIEDARIRSAVRTDFILSAEIMAIALSVIPGSSVWMQFAVLSIVGLGVTLAVYGAVALIVKADDFGIALAQRGGAARAVGVGIVKAMPGVLLGLSIIGTLAMLWVGGGIIIHGLVPYGWSGLENGILALGQAIGGGFQGWLVGAVLSGLFGLLIGAPAYQIVKRIKA